MKPVSDLSAALPILPPHGTEYRMSALTTLTAALCGQVNPNVNLVKTLNGGEFTVFAPTDDAFGKIQPANHRLPENGLGDPVPDLSRRSGQGRSRQRRRHPQDRRGRQRDGDRIVRRVEGQ
jgi:Fasciclin domain